MTKYISVSVVYCVCVDVSRQEERSEHVLPLRSPGISAAADRVSGNRREDLQTAIVLVLSLLRGRKCVQI